MFISSAANGAIAIEVGVAAGRSAAYMGRKIIDSGKQITFYGVDPLIDQGSWGAQNADRWRALGGPKNALLHNLYTHARQEAEVINLLMITSEQASKIFADNSVDFVLIDGDHSYGAVKSDIMLWKSKIKSGGMLSGHDIDFPEVMQAVQESLPDFVRGPFPHACWCWKKP